MEDHTVLHLDVNLEIFFKKINFLGNQGVVVAYPAAEGVVDRLVKVQQDVVGQRGRDLAVLHKLVQRVLKWNIGQ